jgi:hypothetical protein
MAVQIIAYEVRMAWLQAQEQASPQPQYAESPYPPSPGSASCIPGWPESRRDNDTSVILHWSGRRAHAFTAVADA